jgi:Tfp pilus assembly protein PilF
LAERLKSAGYRTGAVVASAVLSRGFGLQQGFDDYDDRIVTGTTDAVSVAELQRPANQVTAAATRWLKGQQGNWFLWVHYYDPHLPYAAPQKYRAAAPNRPYDAEIAFADAQIGELLRSVDRAKTVVVLTADHGESLGDHGEQDHGLFLYDATLKVPLVIAAPGLQPRVVAEQVRHIDLAPTIAELAGAGGPSTPVDGVSLVSLLKGGSRPEVPPSIGEAWYSRYHFGWSELKSIRVGEWKYVAAPKPELYDLRVDKGETRNLAAERAAVAGRLAADLERVTRQFTAPVQRAEQPDPETVKRLQALGYLGSFASTTAGTAGEDPKDHIAAYTQYRDVFNRALGLLARNQPAQAVPLLQKLVKMNVRAFEAHLHLGNAYAALKKLQPALGEYDVAAQLNPSLATPQIEAAKLLSDSGDHATAIVRGLRGTELAPQSDYAHFTLGLIYRRADRLREAGDALLRAVELNPANVRARANLGSVAMRLGKVDLAAAQFSEMIALGYEVAPAHFNLGIIAASRKDNAEAARRFKLALQADPNFKPARDALAKIK